MREGNHPSYHPNAKRTLSWSAHGDADAQFLVALMPQGWSYLALPAVELLLASLPQQQGSQAISLWTCPRDAALRDCGTHR